MKDFLFGTQYYRSPTPLPDEWEKDLAGMERFSIDTVQLRINWRNNERRFDEYDFSDIDRLFDLCEKYNKKVIVKFLLECAPQYVFDDLGGTRIGPRGELLRGGYHGAFFGGWQPCFSNPAIRERAAKFVRTVTARYVDRKNLILYNAWNEIRNRPMEDCFCPYCKERYHRYLKDKFGTVEAYNDFFGASEGSLDTVDFPSTPHGVFDLFTYKKFRGETVNSEKLSMVYDAIRSVDKVRPIMSHVGFSCSFQDNVRDCVNDYAVAKAVDFLGTSVPFEQLMDSFDHRMDMQMLCDFLRSVDKNFTVHELYPSLGLFRLYDSPFDLKYKMMKILSRGSRGICFWQYRAERVGHEMDCSGLMHMNGEPREVAYTAGECGKFLQKYGDILMQSEVKPADLAILFDFDSSLLSEIEDSFGADYHFEHSDPIYYYLRAHQGLYRLINSQNRSVDYVGTARDDDLSKYKAVFAPYYNMTDEKTVARLAKYVEEGGTLILDEGFGLRQPNTWIEPYNIRAPFMEAWLSDRIRHPRFVNADKGSGDFGPYTSVYRVKDAEVLATFENGEPAVQRVKYGKGSVILLGFSLGYDAYEVQREENRDMLEYLLAGTGAKRDTYSDVARGIKENRLSVKDGRELLFLFNAGEDMEIRIAEKVEASLAEGSYRDGILSLPGRSVAVLLLNAR